MGCRLTSKALLKVSLPSPLQTLTISEALLGRVDHLMEPVGCVLRLMMIQLAVTIKLLIHLLRLFLLSREKYRYIV
ncbi:unnamed protein product, partial [Brassica oleracea]